MQLRSVALEGPAVTDLVEPVLVLAGDDERLEAMKSLSATVSRAFDRQREALGSLRIPIAAPEGPPFKAVLMGALACSKGQACALVFDLAGFGRSPESPVGSISFVDLAPADGSALRPGSSVEITATVHYILDSGERGRISLFVVDQSTHPLVEPPPEVEVERSAGEATLSGRFEVPEDAGRVDVLVHLSPLGSGNDRALVAAHYPVEPEPAVP